MADSFTVDGTTVAGGIAVSIDNVTDGGVATGTSVERVKVGFGTNHNYTDVSGSAPLPVDPGAVDVNSLPPVDISTMPSVDINSLPALPTGTNTIGKVDQGAGGLSAWKTDGSAVTQPVSAAALPLPAGAATSALQTQPGVDIGDVTVNNAAGASAVNIQDGGNSITVDATALPLPTGASTAAKQPALGTAGTASTDVLTVQGIAAMTPLLVDGSAVTQPVSAASLPLPTGASTAAKQPALGTAGTASTDVITIQGIASMTALAISAASLPLPSGAATSALQTQPGVDIGDVTVNNAAGAAAVNIQDGGNTITVDGTVTANAGSGTFAVSAAALPLPSGAATAVKQPALGTAGTASADVITIQGIASMTAIAVSAASLPLPSGAATAALQTQPGVDIGDVTVNNASGASAVNIQDGGNTITVDGTVTTNGDVAHGTADSGNPVKIGSKVATTALPTAEASGDRVNAVGDRYGRILTAQIDFSMVKDKAATYTSAQTGTTLITPTSGTQVIVIGFYISTYSTTAGRVIIWFGASGDTTYSEGTDRTVVDSNHLPSASSAPGIWAGECFIPSGTVDYYVKVTTDAAISVRVGVKYYEVTP